jgi:hypothetical protein
MISSPVLEFVLNHGKFWVFQNQFLAKKPEILKGETEGNLVTIEPNSQRQRNVAQFVSKDHIHRDTHENNC